MFDWERETGKRWHRRNFCIFLIWAQSQKRQQGSQHVMMLPFWLKKRVSLLTWGTKNKSLYFPWLIHRSAINDLISKKTVKKNINRPSVFRRRGHVELCIISVALEIHGESHQAKISATLKWAPQFLRNMHPVLLKKKPRLSLRKRLTEFKTVPERPTWCLTQFIKVWWSTVWKAAVIQ